MEPLKETQNQNENSGVDSKGPPPRPPPPQIASPLPPMDTTPSTPPRELSEPATAEAMDYQQITSPLKQIFDASLNAMGHYLQQYLQKTAAAAAAARKE